MPTWAIIAQLIVTEGIPVAQAIYTKWASGKAPTAEDFIELRALALQSAQDRMKAALVKAGVPLDSEHAKTLLALT
jgi:hypothetical protein